MVSYYVSTVIYTWLTVYLTSFMNIEPVLNHSMQVTTHTATHEPSMDDNYLMFVLVMPDEMYFLSKVE